MKVFLIFPSTNFSRGSPSVPLGLLSIATHLKKNGHDVKVYDRTIKKGSIKKQIEDFKPNIVGFSIISFMATKDAIKISRIVKKLNIPIIWGGHMASVAIKNVFDTKLVDFVIVGEGEKTFIELIDAINGEKSFYEVDGIAFVENGEVHINKCRELAELSDFPILDWTLIEPRKYFQPFVCCEKMIRTYSSKGCPYGCAFCSNTGFNNSKHRIRPPEYVINEIEDLVLNYGADGIYFADELWCQTRDQLQTICSMIKERNLDFVWGCQTRVGQFNKKDFQLMYDSGCRWIFFGIESGSAETLRKINKRIDLNSIRGTLDHCKEIGIISIGSFIIGFPDETEKELKETVEFAINADISIYSFNHFTPLPGSDLFDYLISSNLYVAPKTLKGWTKKKVAEEIFQNFSSVPSKDLLVIRSYFTWLAFSQKDVGNQEKPFEFARKTITNIFFNIFRNNIVSVMIAMFLAGKEFFEIVFYVTMFPKIRKKYGMVINREKEKRL